MIRKLALSVAAASLATAPVAAQAADAASVRAPAELGEFEAMAGGGALPVVLTILGAIAIIFAVTESNEDDEGEPISP